MQDRTTSSSRGGIAKIAAAAVLLAIAAFIFLRGDADARQSDVPEDATLYVCLECGKSFELTPAAYDKLAREGGIRAAEGDEIRGRVCLRCPHCGKFGGTRAIPCPKDGSPMPRIGKDGRRGQCPKCGWNGNGPES